MFKIIEGLPEDVLGIEASGKLTHDDYVNKLIPLCDEMLEKQSPLKMFYVIGVDFDGFELAAMWDDAAYGIKHWRDISHIAFVTDEGWMCAVAAMFAPLFPGAIRVFGLSEQEQAKDWISKAERKEAA